MALTNCTINSASVSVAKDTALTSSVANQVLTITPDVGFVVAASDCDLITMPIDALQ